MFNLDAILTLLKGMKGVEHVHLLDQDILDRLKREESTVKATLDIDVLNEGFLKALEREHVVCIVKNYTFRPPPEPTVVLCGDDGCIMGIEVFPHTRGQYESRDDVVWLSDSFVVFPEVIPQGKERFLMPAVSFPEVNESMGCWNVVSCSPSPTSDKMIKDHYVLEDDPKLARILVAFDRC